MTRSPSVALTAALLTAAAALPARAEDDAERRPQRGDCIVATGFETETERQPWSNAEWARWIPVPDRGTCLQITVPEHAEATAHMIQMPVDLSRAAGCKLRFECLARADQVSQPAHSYNGVKFMLHFVSDSHGKQWINENNLFGSFDWKTIGFSAIIPEDVTEAWLLLGLQESSGTVTFDDIRVTVTGVRPLHPQPDPDAPPPFRGHSLPRLRGVMSPNTFRDEDLRVLGQVWNANLIRWQMTTRWGAGYKNEQDYNLDAYNTWLEAELDDLEQALEACRRYGILAVVDLHSPPGGRMPNRDLVMLHEQPYLDAFIAVWQRIARRFRNHPAIWGYDLVNEPVQSKPGPPGMPTYLEAQVMAAKAIRVIDPETPIIFEVDQWDSPPGFRFLEPVDVPRVIYQVHMYHPHQFTHQGIHGNAAGIDYPGTIGGTHCDQQALRQYLAPVRDFQQAYNMHIYVGEFSAIRWAPDNSAYRYLKDCIDIFEEYGWDWSYHAYREWDGWSVEHGPDPNDHTPTETPGNRMRLLLDWFARNRKPER